MLTLTGHTKDVRAVAFAPDGRLISGGGDKKVIVWDRAGTPLETIKPRCIVYAIAVSPDGKLLACGGRPGEFVYLWNLVENQPAGQCNWPATVLDPPAAYLAPTSVSGSVWSLSFSADTQNLAGASRISGSGGDLDGFRARC